MRNSERWTLRVVELELLKFLLRNKGSTWTRIATQGSNKVIAVEEVPEGTIFRDTRKVKEV